MVPAPLPGFSVHGVLCGEDNRVVTVAGGSIESLGVTFGLARWDEWSLDTFDRESRRLRLGGPSGCRR